MGLRTYVISYDMAIHDRLDSDHRWLATVVINRLARIHLSFIFVLLETKRKLECLLLHILELPGGNGIQ